MSFGHRQAAASILLALLMLTIRLPSQARASEADPPVVCGELRDRGLTVTMSDADLDGGDETRFCLVARPEEDTFTAYLPNVTTAEEFRKAKSYFASSLQGKGFDICRVGTWRPLNREGGPRVDLTAADRLDVPSPCPPRIVARDEGATAWIEPMQATLQPVIDRTIASLGVIPHRPLTIDLYTDGAALAAAARVANPSLDEDAAARIVRDGRSLTVLNATRGVFMLFNLVRTPLPGTLQLRLAHEYTHFIQSVAGGTLDAYPMWFLEGQADFQMQRIAGTDWDRRMDAARRERAGIAPRLADLITPEQWTDAEGRLGSEAVYSRGFSALAYIAERWGYGATVRLLHAGSDLDPARFDRALTTITGLDLDGLDAALSTWLRNASGQVTFYNDSPLANRLIFTDGRTVDIPACPICTFLKDGDACQDDGRPSAQLDLPPGDYEVLRITPDDRVHFPDSTLHLQVEPGSILIRCLALKL